MFPPVAQGSDSKREGTLYRYDCDYCGETLRWDEERQYFHGVPMHVLQECEWMTSVNRDQVLRRWALGVERYSHWQPPLS